MYFICGIFSNYINKGFTIWNRLPWKEFVYAFDTQVKTQDIRSFLNEPLGSSPEVKLFGSDSEILIRTDNDLSTDEVQNLIEDAISANISGASFSMEKSDSIGPRFAEDLKGAAAQSVIYAIVIIFLYILIRFRKWTFSVGAVAALVHDVVITLGIFTLLSDIVSFNLFNRSKYHCGISHHRGILSQ